MEGREVTNTTMYPFGTLMSGKTIWACGKCGSLASSLAYWKECAVCTLVAKIAKKDAK